jgi:hypothetical protein
LNKRKNKVEKINKIQTERHRSEIKSFARSWRLISGVALLLLFAMVVPSLHPLAQGPRLIEITAGSDNLFKVKGQKLAVITVKPKEVLKFKILSKWGDEKDPKWPGCPHSFSVKGYEDQGWNVCLKEGNNEFVLVAPSTPGNYKIECLAKCGKGHDDMIMKMIVTP